MSHFFISYKREDAKFVDELEDRLSEADLLPWRDTRLEGGDEWKKVIDLALDECYALILIITPEALNSHYVTYEWAYVMGAKKVVVPILLREVNLEQAHDKIKDLQYESASNPFFWDKLIGKLKKIKEQYQRKEFSRPIQQALAVLDNPNPEERQAGVTSLKNYRDKEAIEALASATTHGYPDVKLMASMALAELTNYDDLRAKPSLVEAWLIFNKAIYPALLENLNINSDENELARLATDNSIYRHCGISVHEISETLRQMGADDILLVVEQIFKNEIKVDILQMLLPLLGALGNKGTFEYLDNRLRNSSLSFRRGENNALLTKWQSAIDQIGARIFLQ